MALVNRPLTVLVPATDTELAGLLEGRCADLATATRIVEIRNVSDLNRGVETNPFCCLFGTLSSRWAATGRLFDALESTTLLWPPAYAVVPVEFSKSELVTLSQNGIIWADDLDSVMSAAELNLILTGMAWKTQFGFLFQKLNRQTISSGEHMVVLTTEKGQYARIQFRSGNVVAAEFEKETGFEALYNIALIDNWRIDVHQVFLGIEPRLMNKPLMKVIRRLVEMAEERKQVLSMGRPPGMTRELSSKVVTGIRKALASGDGAAVEGILQQARGDGATWEASSALLGESKPRATAVREDPIAGIAELTADSTATGRTVSEATTPKEVPLPRSQPETTPAAKPATAVPTQSSSTITAGSWGGGSGKSEAKKSIAAVSSNEISNEKKSGKMADLTLQEFIANIGGAFGGAIITTDGAYTAAEGDFDVDTVAAVASMSTEHLGGIANALNIQGLEIASFTGTSYTVFLKRQGDTFVVSFGRAVKNPGVTAKKLCG